MSKGVIVFALLAAGRSLRFGAGDKLVAPFRADPLIAQAGSRLENRDGVQRLAIVAPGAHAPANWLAGAGWKLVENPRAAEGQGTSVACAARAARDLGARGLLVALGDMPFVREDTLERLIVAADTYQAAMCRGPDTLLPPAIFRASLFDRLEALTGDKGARVVFASLADTCEIPITAREALDIDTPADLAALDKDAAHA